MKHDNNTQCDERRLETIVGNLLRTGVIAAAVVVLAGAGVYLTHHGFAKPDYKVFHGTSPDLRSIGGIVADVFSARGRGLIQFGVLMLIATPVLRVAFLLVGFALERDRLYVGVSFVVLVVLVYSIFGGNL
jgi:uncharacterized membrane protein